MTVPRTPLLLVVDGNSLLHRAYHAAATGRLLDDAGRPVWAVKGLVTFVARAAARLRPDAVLVGFDCPERLARKADYPDYKAHRPDKPAELAEQLGYAPEIMRAARFPVVVPDGYEADDVLASSAAKAGEHDWRAVVVTSDRDAFALLDATTSVLHVRNGGHDEAVLVTAASLPDLCGVQARQYRDYAALRGDPSDNLPGVRGFGATTAARLLAEFDTVEAAWAALDSGDGGRVESAIGSRAASHLGSPECHDVVARNRRLMRMRTDLPLPDLDSMRLPIDFAAMRGALAARGIILGPSLWALTGRRPPDEYHPVVPAPRTARGLRSPCTGQLSLF